MDTSFVLSHLQNQFSGQLVLYIDDIAKVLGKSDKAISNLIARKSLPFEIKKVGGSRCVDIFQVAQFLASDAEVGQQVVEKPARAPKSIKAVRAASIDHKAGKAPPVTAPALSAALMSPMAAKILKMRHGYSEFMGRLSLQKQNSDELLFLQELSERLFFSADSLALSFVATVRKLAPKGYKVQGLETTRYFDAQEPAILYLMAKVYEADRGRSKNACHFTLKNRDETLIHLVKNGNHWLQIENSVRVEFGGLW